ncbi:MAG: N-acetylmuramoyl-L-alanine amidase [uncultured bacterium]|nr:MAG: N-acetylmuramoyl-L-alanine amidase [uncultured bacterium]
MNKFITNKILYFAVTIGLCSTAFCGQGVDVATETDADAQEVVVEVKTRLMDIAIDETKMLEPMSTVSGKGKMYEPAKYPPSFIVLHYAVTTTMGQTVNAYYGAGVSAHFTVDKDGKIYQHVDDGNVAYHAGISYWQGKYSVNWYSIGVEQVNTGWDVDNKKWKEPRSPSKQADGKAWETWSESQVESVAKLIRFLSERDGTKPWNIIGHSDCSCGRKVDPGPFFPWKRLRDTYGVGFWPEEDEAITTELTTKLNSKDYIQLLHALGYPIKGFECSVRNTEELKCVWAPEKIETKMGEMRSMSERLTDPETISAFQYHYMQDKFERDPAYRSGDLDVDTQTMILRCIKSIMKQSDDYYSLEKLKKLRTEGVLSDSAKQVVEGFAQSLGLNLDAQDKGTRTDL